MDELEAIRQRRMDELKKSLENASYPDKPVTVMDADFDGFVTGYPLVVVDCWAEWCGPCRMLAPTIAELAGKYQGKVVFGKVNVDNNRMTAMKYGVASIPTLLIFKDGKLVDSVIGAVPKQTIVQRLQSFM